MLGLQLLISIFMTGYQSLTPAQAASIPLSLNNSIICLISPRIEVVKFNQVELMDCQLAVQKPYDPSATIRYFSQKATIIVDDNQKSSGPVAGSSMTFGYERTGQNIWQKVNF